MKVLAVDTSALVAGVAVMDGNRLLGEYNVNNGKTHSQRLMPMIEELLRSLELKPADIDIFAAAIGPGSFTGLRIGVTTVKTMAYAAQKHCVGVPTLDSLAYNIPMTEMIVCPMMDARNNQVYTALYQWDNGRQLRITDYMGIPVPELKDLIISKNKRVIFTGDAMELYRDYFNAELGNSCTFAPACAALQRASSTAQLALLQAIEGQTQTCFELSPYYLRKAQAERMLEKMKG